jgi:hypothetical protein
VVATFAMDPAVTLEIVPGRPLTIDDGPVGLAREMAASEVASACLVTQWLAFADQMDRSETSSCAKRALHDRVATGGAGVLEMIRQAARAELDGVRALGGAP